MSVIARAALSHVLIDAGSGEALWGAHMDRRRLARQIKVRTAIYPRCMLGDYRDTRSPTDAVREHEHCPSDDWAHRIDDCLVSPRPGNISNLHHVRLLVLIVRTPTFCLILRICQSCTRFEERDQPSSGDAFSHFARNDVRVASARWLDSPSQAP